MIHNYYDVIGSIPYAVPYLLITYNWKFVLLNSMPLFCPFPTPLGGTHPFESFTHCILSIVGAMPHRSARRMPLNGSEAGRCSDVPRLVMEVSLRSVSSPAPCFTDSAFGIGAGAALSFASTCWRACLLYRWGNRTRAAETYPRTQMVSSRVGIKDRPPLHGWGLSSWNPMFPPLAQLLPAVRQVFHTTNICPAILSFS